MKFIVFEYLSGQTTRRPQIADFGLARHLPQGSLAESMLGSPLYMAPEVLSNMACACSVRIEETFNISIDFEQNPLFQ